MILRQLSCLSAFLLISIGNLCQSNGQALAPADLRSQLQKQLELLVENEELPGITAAIVLPDGEVIAATAGLAWIEPAKPMQTSARLMSASIGKTYFSAMAMDLILQGKLSLDDLVSRHLGDRPWFSRIANHDTITVGHLMRHQTGIPRYILNRQVWRDAMQDPDRHWKPGQQLEYIYDREPLHPAGEGWAYSDTNYILLGLILEQISGQKVYAYVQQSLLNKHELSDTIPNNQRRLSGLVQGYCKMFAPLGIPEQTVKDGEFVFNPAMEWCGGGFCCTASDLARWAHILYSGKAIDGDYLDLLTRDAADSSPMLGPESRYGLGVIVRPTSLGPLLGHDGGFPGYTSTMGYFPKQRIAAAVMINTDARGALAKPAYQVMTDLVAKAIDRDE